MSFCLLYKFFIYHGWRSLSIIEESNKLTFFMKQKQTNKQTNEQTKNKQTNKQKTKTKTKKGVSLSHEYYVILSLALLRKSYYDVLFCDNTYFYQLQPFKHLEFAKP